MEQEPTANFDNRLPPLSAKYPWFVVQNLDDTGYQSFYTMQDESCHYQCRIPELLGRRIRGYFHGWVVLSNNNLWSVWNPVTSKIINLPPLTLNKPEPIVECCLSSPPDDPLSVLLLTITGQPMFVFCHLGLKSDKLTWRRMAYGILKCPASYNGNIYAFCGKNVIEIDIILRDGEVLLKLSVFGRYPHVFPKGFPISVKFLKGSPTELFFIKLVFNEDTKKTLSNVYLFKWDMSSMRWEEMLINIKDAVFYVDLAHDYSVYYKRAIVPELGGYIHIRDETGKMMYSFDYEDRTISISSVAYPTSYMSVWECRLEEDYDDPDLTQVYEKEDVEDDKIVVRSVIDDEAESNESRLLNLPLDLLETIMDHCIGIEYMSFRATCKRCHLAAPSIKWSNKTALRRLHKYSLVTPWLMVVDKMRSIITFTDPISGDSYSMRRLQDSVFRDEILCSRFGWLLLCGKFSSMVFFNPFTSDTHKLPILGYRVFSLCFSAPPTSPDCLVVGFVEYYGNETRLCVHSVASKKDRDEFRWHVIRLDFGGGDPHNLRFPTFHGQDLYVLCDKGIVYVLKNLCDQAFSFRKVAKACEGEYYLVKCDQQVLLVIVGVVGEYVEVYKLNNNNNDWVKIKSIGKYTVYICGRTCLCIEAKAPEMKNKIFFPRLHSKNGKIVFYSLKTRRYHIFNGKSIEESRGFGIKQTNNHAWVEPAWS